MPLGLSDQHPHAPHAPHAPVEDERKNPPHQQACPHSPRTWRRPVSVPNQGEGDPTLPARVEEILTWRSSSSLLPHISRTQGGDGDHGRSSAGFLPTFPARVEEITSASSRWPTTTHTPRAHGGDTTPYRPRRTLSPVKPHTACLLPSPVVPPRVHLFPACLPLFTPKGARPPPSEYPWQPEPPLGFCG
jgi:hypothetical protein